VEIFDHYPLLISFVLAASLIFVALWLDLRELKKNKNE